MAFDGIDHVRSLISSDRIDRGILENSKPYENN